ncbi:hypothetical protein [Prochlorococcus marinus]|uniref:hypothetical protein n=1 Tax=Prochlorococcus marinus TaxID=1219 RepID=UPI0022B3B9F7|nr:hypothetical protein [Prochlorococcus marinus]
MEKKTNEFLIRLMLILLSMFIPIAAADLILKQLNLPKQNGRIMLLGGGSLKTDEENLIRKYTPNRTIRHAAVYGKNVIYDYTFKTNKYGFRNTYSCNLETKNPIVAITGDSFTEGQGSKISWTKDLQFKLCNIGTDSINLAMPGYGIIDMSNSLVFAKKRLNAEKAIFSIITSDIYRRNAIMHSNAKCSAYYVTDLKLCGISATWWHIPKEMNSKEIITFAKSKYKFGLRSSLSGLEKYAKNILKDVIRKITYNNPSNFLKKTGIITAIPEKKEIIIKNSIQALNKIATIYKPENIILVIIPNKSDRIKSVKINHQMASKESDLQNFLQLLDPSISKVDLRSCPLTSDHFYLKDGHPNKKGQQLIGQCVANNISVKKFLNIDK